MLTLDIAPRTSPYDLHRIVYDVAHGAERVLYRYEPGRVLIQSERNALPELQHGETVSFALRANPQACRNGKRRPLREPEQWRAWLERHFDGAAQIVEYSAEARAPLQFCKPNGHGVTLHTVEYSGVLCVTDPARFDALRRAGIGSGKGFGFGLLLVQASA